MKNPNVVIRWFDNRDQNMAKSIVPRDPIIIQEQPRTPPEPSLWEMEQNFEEHASQVIQYYKTNREIIVSKEQFLTRLNEGCRQCPQNLWNEDARLGLGKCLHKSCGCTKFKLWFKALKCPIGAWPNE